MNISFSNIEAGELLEELDKNGIYVSNGGIYASGELEPSHVLLALDVPYELAKGNLRISIGKYNTEEDIDYLLENLIKIVEKLRNSPKEEKKTTCKFSGKCGGNCSSCHS